MNIGIIDLVTAEKSTGFYNNYIQPMLPSLMPQMVGVWSDRLGHNVWYYTYTGVEDLKNDLVKNLDIVFISTYTPGAYLAYAIANYYNKLGVITVLGGPHAKAYPEDAGKYFDWVVGLCDEALIGTILKEGKGIGTYISNDKNPNEFPSVKERWKYVEYTLQKMPRFMPPTIPMLSSVGCPFRCDFCVDSSVPYEQLDISQLRSDFKFLKSTGRNFVILWYDPNFGVKLADTLDVIEETDCNFTHMSELNLSMLTESVSERMGKAGFWGIGPGLESWTSYDSKASTSGFKSPTDKVYKIANQLEMVTKYIPHIQLNVMFGLDEDLRHGVSTAFSLTKKFLSIIPQVYVNFQTLTIFGENTKLAKQFKRQNRILAVPYNMLDGFRMTNVKLCCDLNEFYKYYSDLVRYSTSPVFFARRLYKTRTWQQKLLYMFRYFSNRVSVRAFAEPMTMLNDPFYKQFFDGEHIRPPAFFYEKLRYDLGDFIEFLPKNIELYFLSGVHDGYFKNSIY